MLRNSAMEGEFDGPKKAFRKSSGGAREKHRERRERKKAKASGQALDTSTKAAKARNPRVHTITSSMSSPSALLFEADRIPLYLLCLGIQYFLHCLEATSRAAQT